MNPGRPKSTDPGSSSTEPRSAATLQPPFVGRDHEVQVLGAALEEARTGPSRLVLLSGEPGIGKTRLLGELASMALDRGMRVCWGRCWEGGGAPAAFWPWIQVLRACGADTTDAQPESDPSPLTDLIARSVLRAGARLPLESEHARFALFDATATFLAEAATRRPLLIALDDLHAADPASLLLLHFVLRTIRDAPILFAGTHREAEPRVSAEHARLLAEIAREGTTLALRPLGRTESAMLIEAIGGARPSLALVGSLHAASSGNPFFLDELVRMIVAEDPRGWMTQRAPLVLPDRVRLLVRQRLQALPAATIEVLEVASVVGQEFDPHLIGQVLAAGGDEVADRLRAAITAGLVFPARGRDDQHPRFAHALVREVLYDELPAVRRAALHRMVGSELTTLRSGRLQNVLPMLADHFSLAGASAEALEYSERAGRNALAQMAYEDAIVHLSRALEMLVPTSTVTELHRATLLLDLGQAYRRAGDPERGRDMLVRAGEIAKRCGAPDLLARAGLAFGWSFETWVADAAREQLLEDALASGIADEALRTRVLGALGILVKTWHPDRWEQALQLADEAVAAARRMGDPAALGHALHVARWVRGNRMEPDRSLAATTEIQTLARRAGDVELLAQTLRFRVADHLALGDVSAADREIARHARLARELHLPLYLWYSAQWKAMRTLLDGSLDDAEQLADQALEIGRQVEPANAGATFAGQLFEIRRHQGRLAEVLPLLQGLSDTELHSLAVRSGLACMYAEVGDEPAARAQFDVIAAARFAIPELDGWIFAMSSLADCCHVLRDVRAAALLYDAMAPWERRYAVVEPGFACFGAVDRSLGLLATVLERWDAAERHFEQAVELNRRLGARAWTTRTNQEYAAMLLARDGSGDHARAHALAEATRQDATTLGMASVAERCTMILANAARAPATAQLVPARSSSAARESRTARLVTRGVLVREGDVYRVEYAGRAFRLRHHRGLAFLRQLLRRPGMDVPALDLIRGDGGLETSGATIDPALTGRSPGDAGELLDAQARAEYRRRLEELHAELADAEARHDLGQLERLRTEEDFLVGELARAVGLGGRSRRAAAPAERARINVTRAITETLKRIAMHSPELAHHLRETIRTGALCAYRPDPRVAIEWET